MSGPVVSMTMFLLSFSEKPLGVVVVTEVIVGATASMMMFLLSFNEKPLGIVRVEFWPALSWSVAPAARTRGELVSSGFAVCPADTMYVPVAIFAWVKGVMV